MGAYDIPSADLGTLPTLVFKDMVYNRLPFLTKNEDTDAIIANFLLEEGYEMEPCFNVGLVDGVMDWELVGIETSYNVAQKSLLADLVSAYMILIYTAAATGGNNQADTPTAPVVKFLKKAKAGSADVEWEAVKMKDTPGLFDSASGLLSKYKNSAARKARNFGCTIDICDDCVGLAVGELPLLTITGCSSCG